MMTFDTVKSLSSSLFNLCNRILLDIRNKKKQNIHMHVQFINCRSGSRN